MHTHPSALWLTRNPQGNNTFRTTEPFLSSSKNQKATLLVQQTGNNITIKYQSMAAPARATASITFNVQASSSFGRGKPNAKKPNREGRRGLLILSTATAITLVSDSQTELLNKYLKKSQENKAKNDKERLDNFYKRNYKDYFSFSEGDLRQKKDLSESEKAILDWLDANK